MAARLLLKERLIISGSSFLELVVWQLSQPVPGSEHGFKYRLAFVRKGVCLLRYDNEAGKGDTKHVGERQVAYQFAGLDQLQEDFWNDVREHMKQP